MHTPQKSKNIKGKYKANKLKDPVDIANYKKQHNLVVSISRQSKTKYFNKVSNTEKLKTFLGNLQAILFK